MSSINNMNRLQNKSEIYFGCDPNKCNYSSVMNDILLNLDPSDKDIRRIVDGKQDFKKSQSTHPNNSTTINQNNQNFSESLLKKYNKGSGVGGKTGSEIPQDAFKKKEKKNIVCSFNNDKKSEDPDNRTKKTPSKILPPKINLNKILVNRKSHRQSLDKCVKPDELPVTDQCFKKIRFDPKKKSFKNKPDTSRKKKKISNKHNVKTEFPISLLNTMSVHNFPPPIFTSYKDLPGEHSPPRMKSDKKTRSPQISKPHLTNKYSILKYPIKNTIQSLTNNNTSSKIQIVNTSRSK